MKQKTLKILDGFVPLCIMMVVAYFAGAWWIALVLAYCLVLATLLALADIRAQERKDAEMQARYDRACENRDRNKALTDSLPSS